MTSEIVNSNTNAVVQELFKMLVKFTDIPNQPLLI